MSKKQFKYIKSEIVFAGENGERYMVVFKGEHNNIEYSVWKNDTPIATGRRQYGHANKTIALLLLNQALNPAK